VCAHTRLQKCRLAGKKVRVKKGKEERKKREEERRK